MGQSLDDGDVSAEALPHGSEFEANDATAKDQRRSRNPVHLQCLIGGDDATCNIESGERTRVGAGRKDNVAAGDVASVNGDGVGVDQAGPQPLMTSTLREDSRP